MGRDGGNRAGSQGHIPRPFVNISHPAGFTVLSLARTPGISPENLLEAGEGGRILQDRDGRGCPGRDSSQLPQPHLLPCSWKSGIETQAAPAQLQVKDE